MVSTQLRMSVKDGEMEVPRHGEEPTLMADRLALGEQVRVQHGVVQIHQAVGGDQVAPIRTLLVGMYDRITVVFALVRWLGRAIQCSVGKSNHPILLSKIRSTEIKPKLSVIQGQQIPRLEAVLPPEGGASVGARSLH